MRWTCGLLSITRFDWLIDWLIDIPSSVMLSRRLKKFLGCIIGHLDKQPSAQGKMPVKPDKYVEVLLNIISFLQPMVYNILIIIVEDWFNTYLGYLQYVFRCTSVRSISGHIDVLMDDGVHVRASSVIIRSVHIRACWRYNGWRDAC